MSETDYRAGEQPVPVGSVVEYHTGRRKTVRWVVTDHLDPLKHPAPPPPEQTMTLEEAYPDGVAYFLWPEDVPVKFGLRDQSVGWVRRTRFKVLERKALDGGEK